MNELRLEGQGSSTAKIAVVGDYPSLEDLRNSRPFSGLGGTLTRDFLAKAGCTSAYFTYTLKSRPSHFKELRNIKDHELAPHMEQLRKEFAALDPNVILVLGDFSLRALAGVHGIDKYRGSILPCITKSDCKVVASLNPASLITKDAFGKMRSFSDSTFIQWDFNRAVKQSEIRGYNPPRRHLQVCKSSIQLERFLNANKGRNKVSVDIETYHTFPICIGFAFTRNEAMSIPLFNVQDYRNIEGIPHSQILSIWKQVAELLADPNVLKIGQNFKFDERQLVACNDGKSVIGLNINGFFFDTNLAFKTLFPELSGSLQFIASVLTEEPYWKEEGKGFNPKKDKFDRLLLYNAKDAAVTYECYEEIEKYLQAIKIDKTGRTLADFFYERVMPLHPFYMRIESRGMLRDNTVQQYLLEKYKTKQLELQTELNTLTAEHLDKPVNVASPKDVPLLLFECLKLPKRASCDEKTLDALSRNVVKDGYKKRILKLILEIRKVRKTIGTYIEAEVDHRNRLLTGYRLTLETGRTSTSILKPPVTVEKLGIAFQTITKHGDVGADIREEIIPDPGYCFFEFDLSQAEARVVALLANDTKLLKMFKYGVDIHRVTSALIINKCPDMRLFFDEPDDVVCKTLKNDINTALKAAIDDEFRQVGKKGRHACNYDMGKGEASIQLECSEKKAGEFLDAIHMTNPNIRGVFHAEIVQALKDNNRVLVTPHGRRRQFLNRWGRDLFKEAYANIPQGTVSDHLKFAAQRIEQRAPWFLIVQEAHDSILGLCPLDVGGFRPFKHVERLAKIVKEECEQEIDFTHCTLSRGSLVIPCDIGVGDKSWKYMTGLDKFRIANADRF